MSKASTLAQVINDISRKDLNMARMRLHGLIGTYPNDLGLRHILGRLCLEMGKPWKAGRFLFLVEDKTVEVHDAVRFFLVRHKDPFRRLGKLKLKGHINDFEPGYAKDKLQDLLDECGNKDGKFPEHIRTKPSTLFIWMICSVWALMIIVPGLGLYYFIKWIIHLIGRLF